MLLLAYRRGLKIWVSFPGPNFSSSLKSSLEKKLQRGKLLANQSIERAKLEKSVDLTDHLSRSPSLSPGLFDLDLTHLYTLVHHKMLTHLHHADHFVIYSKPNTVPLVAFGLTKLKDKDTGEEKERYKSSHPCPKTFSMSLSWDFGNDLQWSGLSRESENKDRMEVHLLEGFIVRVLKLKPYLIFLTVSKACVAFLNIYLVSFHTILTFRIIIEASLLMQCLFTDVWWW